MLSGLKHAHDKGVVHRDIKPDNIFLAKKDGDQVVKILDFGIAKLYAGNADDPATTRAGLTVGTPAYLSPEQAVGGAITPASDLYSTSVVLYEMLTGRAPFTDEDPLAMLRAHVSMDPPAFAEVAPDLELPPAIENVVRHGLEKVSAERISNARDYANELDEAIRAAGFDPMTAVPRSSSQLGIPSGPHGVPTPLPGSMFMTPPSGTATPSPYHGMGSAPTQSLDHIPKSRMTSIAEINEPLGKGMKTAAIAIVLVALLGAAYFMFIHSSKPSDGTTKTAIVPMPVADKETRLKAALHDLENGKTCADRKAAIPVIVQLGGSDAIAALKKARYRMRGGVLGIGDSNTNACLKSDAETAIQALGGTLK